MQNPAVVIQPAIPKDVSFIVSQEYGIITINDDDLSAAAPNVGS
jgi:hypothetical protein